MDACDIITRVRLVSKTRLKKLCGGPCFVCVESELFQKNEREKNLTAVHVSLEKEHALVVGLSRS